MNDPRIEAAALEEAADVIWMRANAEHGVCDQDRETDSYTKAEEVAREVIGAYLAAADKAATIATIEELDALPVGSVVLAHWEDDSQPDYHAMKCRDGGASSSGFTVASGRHWTGMASWGATLTVLHFGSAK